MLRAGKNPPHHREQHDHQCGYHEHFVIEARIEHITGLDMTLRNGGSAGCTRLFAERRGIVVEDGAEILAAQSRLHAIDSIGGYHHRSGA